MANCSFLLQIFASATSWSQHQNWKASYLVCPVWQRGCLEVRLPLTLVFGSHYICGYCVAGLPSVSALVFSSVPLGQEDCSLPDALEYCCQRWLLVLLPSSAYTPPSRSFFTLLTANIPPYFPPTNMSFFCRTRRQDCLMDRRSPLSCPSHV